MTFVDLYFVVLRSGCRGVVRWHCLHCCFHMALAWPVRAVVLLAFWSFFGWTPTFSVLLGFAGFHSNTFSVLLEIAIDNAHARCAGNPATRFRQFSDCPHSPLSPCSDASELVDRQAPAAAQRVHCLELAHHYSFVRPLHSTTTRVRSMAIALGRRSGFLLEFCGVCTFSVYSEICAAYF